MKKLRYYLTIIALLAIGAGCGKNDDAQPNKGKTDPGKDPEVVVPEGYFLATFNLGSGTRAPVEGEDDRVQHIKYLIFNEEGDFIKEGVALEPTDGPPSWPFATTKTEMLPIGTYQVVFLGNVDDSLFPEAANEVLTGYEEGYAAARIQLPDTGLTRATEYYMGKCGISDLMPTVDVLLQRIIGGAALHRNTIDAQEALDKLVRDIFDNINESGTITSQLEGIVREDLLDALGDNALFNMLDPAGQAALNGLIILIAGPFGSIEDVIEAIVDPLVLPITNLLIEPLVADLVHQVGGMASGNADEETLIEYLGVLLNPWIMAEMAIVTLNGFPHTVDLDLDIVNSYPDGSQFLVDITEGDVDGNGTIDERDAFVRGFGGQDWDVRSINVIDRGIVAGLIIDQVVDDYLLMGSFVDITDPLLISETQANVRYRNNYSLVDLRNTGDGTHGFTLSVRLGDVANLDDAIMGGLDIPIVSDVIDILTVPILTLLENVTISLPINIPLLGVDNLSVQGGWGENERYL